MPPFIREVPRMRRRVFRHSPTAQPPHVILNLFQDLLIITNREILNNRKFREPQRLTFQNDIPPPLEKWSQGSAGLNYHVIPLHFLTQFHRFA